VVTCKLSKRQRLLYNEFMSLSSTREKLAEGRYMSVINILMQLRKVCNHPDLFDPRPIVSSFAFDTLDYHVPSLIFNLSEEINTERLEFLLFFQPSYPVMELHYSAFNSHRAKHLQTPPKLIEEIMTAVPSIPLAQATYLTGDSKASISDTSSSFSQSQGSKDSELNKYDFSKYFYDSTFHGVTIVEN
jgi:SNF2 family DNA or RNA helicase